MNSLTEMPLWALLLQSAKFDTGGGEIPSPEYLFKKLRAVSTYMETEPPSDQKWVLITKLENKGFIVVEYSVNGDVKGIVEENRMEEYLNSLPSSFIAVNFNPLTSVNHRILYLRGNIKNQVERIMEEEWLSLTRTQSAATS